MGQKGPFFFGRHTVTRRKVHRAGSESGGQSQHRAQTVRRIEPRRDVADSGTRNCDVTGGELVAGRSVVVLRPFQCAPVVGGSQYDGNFSPDGHWLAYFPDETGQPEVYIVPFPETGGKPESSPGESPARSLSNALELAIYAALTLGSPGQMRTHNLKLPSSNHK